VPNPRVLVSGQPTVTISGPYAVAACPFNAGGSPVPCVTGQWVVGTVRVLSTGQPLVHMISQAVCVPNGTPLMPVAAQTRAIAT
jgi:hypothetical protein